MKRIHIKKPDIKGFFTKLKKLEKGRYQTTLQGEEGAQTAYPGAAAQQQICEKDAACL